MDSRDIRNTVMSSGNNLFLKSQFFKRLTKFVVSVSVFSLFLSPNFCFSRLTLQLLTHTIDKNYMFLFCNGLLVIVAKYPSLVTSFSSSSSKSNGQNHNNSNKTMDYEYFENYRTISKFVSIPKQYQQEPFLEEEVMKTIFDSSHDVGLMEEPAKDIYMAQEYQEMQRGGGGEEEAETEAERDVEVQDEEEEEETCDQKDEEVLSPHEQGNDDGFHGEFGETIEPGEEEEEEEEEEETGGMTAEEMNKKFDEFIRKMKEELRIEAQRQLIVV